MCAWRLFTSRLHTGGSGSGGGTTGSATTGTGGPSIVGEPLLTNDGMMIGDITRVTRNLICTQRICVDTKTRPVLTAEGLVVNVPSSAISLQ